MSNAEKLQRTLEQGAREYKQLPEYLKRESARPRPIDRTVRPMAETKKR